MGPTIPSNMIMRWRSNMSNENHLGEKSWTVSIEELEAYVYEYQLKCWRKILQKHGVGPLSDVEVTASFNGFMTKIHDLILLKSVEESWPA